MNNSTLIQSRRSLGLSQEAMAWELGVSVRHYHRLEAGQCAIRKPLAMAVDSLVKGNV